MIKVMQKTTEVVGAIARFMESMAVSMVLLQSLDRAFSVQADHSLVMAQRLSRCWAALQNFRNGQS